MGAYRRAHRKNSGGPVSRPGAGGLQTWGVRRVETAATSRQLRGRDPISHFALKNRQLCRCLANGRRRRLALSTASTGPNLIVRDMRPLEHRAEKWEPVFRKNDVKSRFLSAARDSRIAHVALGATIRTVRAPQRSGKCGVRSMCRSSSLPPTTGRRHQGPAVSHPVGPFCRPLVGATPRRPTRRRGPGTPRRRDAIFELA